MNYKLRISLIEIKVYSFLYLIINNLTLIKNNFHLLENVKLFTNENKIIFESIIEKISREEKITIDTLLLDPQILKRIEKFASIKHILNKVENDEFKILELLE